MDNPTCRYVSGHDKLNRQGVLMMKDLVLLEGIGRKEEDFEEVLQNRVSGQKQAPHSYLLPVCLRSANDLLTACRAYAYDYSSFSRSQSWFEAWNDVNALNLHFHQRKACQECRPRSDALNSFSCFTIFRKCYDIFCTVFSASNRDFLSAAEGLIAGVVSSNRLGCESLVQTASQIP